MEEESGEGKEEGESLGMGKIINGEVKVERGDMVGNFDDTLAAMKNKIIGKEEAVRLAHNHDDALVSL